MVKPKSLLFFLLKSFHFPVNIIILSVYLDIFRYKALGIRLDSGDLAYLSKEAHKFFKMVEKEINAFGFGDLVITASNDISKETLDALNKQVMEEAKLCKKPFKISTVKPENVFVMADEKLTFVKR